MRFFHEDVKTDCPGCGGRGCVHCAERKLAGLVGELRVGLLSVDQLERVVDALALRPGLRLNLIVVVPGPAPAKEVWETFAEGKEAPWMGQLDGTVYAQAGMVPVPQRKHSGRGRVRDLLEQMAKENPESHELQHARQMLRGWLGHETAYAAEQAAHWRAEIDRLEAVEQPKQAGTTKTKRTPASPRRIVLSRAKGWRLPAGAVKVDRATRWGNPFKVGDLVTGIPGLCRGATEERELATPEEAVHCYRLWLQGDVTLYNQRPPAVWEIRQHLQGKHLACWCKEGAWCHADVLLQVANGGEVCDAA